MDGNLCAPASLLTVFPMKPREEDIGRICDRVGLNLRLPAQSIVDRQSAGHLPAVLHEQGQFVLRDALGARVFHGQPANAGLLQVEQHRSRDSRAMRGIAPSVLTLPSEHST